MASPDSGHPRNDHVSAGWVLPVPILPNELFSSWLTRAALTQGCDPLVLTGVIWPRCRVWTRDLDRGASDEQLSALARLSGIDASIFRTMSLRPAAQAVTPRNLDHLATWPWVLAQGSRNRKRYGGLQYCPCCVRDAKTPYYRQQWRLAWHTGCPVHGVLLMDRCPDCHAPLEPHRLHAEAGHVAICATCKGDLRDACSTAITPTALAFQEATDQVLLSGHGHYGAKQLTSDRWFELSRYFVTLLRQVALRPHTGLRAFATALGVVADDLLPPATGLALELLPVRERAMLLAGAWEMLQSGPDRFLAAAKEASLSRAALHERRRPMPDSMMTLLETLPDKEAHRRCRLQGKTCRPRSRQAVMRMFARLQRKLLVLDE